MNIKYNSNIKCLFNNCLEKVTTKGYCDIHYRKYYGNKNKDILIQKRKEISKIKKLERINNKINDNKNKIFFSKFSNNTSGYKNYNSVDINIIKKYLTLGLDRKQIANKLNIGVDKLRRIVNKNNIKIVWCSSQKKINELNEIKNNKELKDNFIYYYYETVLERKDIYKKLNITVHIYDILKSLYICNKKSSIYKEKNKDIILQKVKEKRRNYLLINKKILWEKTKIFYKNKYYNDINYRITEYLRNSIRHRIKHYSGKKHLKTEQIIGCTIEKLKKYLEQQWYNNKITGEIMNWKNFGNGYNKWQIHHIQHLINFNMMSDEEQKKGFHYNNCQPLWYDDHVKIHGKHLSKMVIKND